MVKIKLLEEKIEKVKKKIMEINNFRPGSLTVQKGARGGSFYQISYTYKGRGRSEFVRPTNVKIVRKQLSNYKEFRKLVDKLIDLSFEKCSEEIKKRNEAQDKEPINK